MDIKWSALGEVALVSFAVGVAIVVIFSVGILASAQGSDDGAPSRGGTLGNAAAGLCFLACALIAAYGIYLIVPQFH
ncbi:hypothetical protein GCM10027176_81410 [Actinoallomurus bryophytorum]|uniref:Uncharacterized protein n=1 Tax=Actinoallomurus bryophytorum TaxID=1490222 RepID=A0A543CIM6_9ACTN|nr:hypothetical protein [Actinoallomurus bryophytorum]TQL96757.1 hypothetical protein FB559_2309 [Actinoallomurus bryophytorum]